MFEFLSKIPELAAQVANLAVQAAPLLAVGVGIKHVDKIPIIKSLLGPITKRIPNDFIPFINLGLDLAFGGMGLGAAGAALIHQAAKVLTRKLFGDRAANVQAAVGPGSRLSI